MRCPGERVVVVGAGVSGVAAAKILFEEGAQVRVTDERPRDQIEAAATLESMGIRVSGGGHHPSELSAATLVYASPGVPPHAPVLAWARERDLPIWGELELGARLAETPYLAVTGTNGKTTTTGMIESCMRAAGVDAVACGNIGHPFPVAARAGHGALVVEASSFQLVYQESFHPKVSVLLNVAPDHLDWHGSDEAYARSKARIYRLQRRGDAHVGNRDDERAERISAAAPCSVVWFGLEPPRDGETGYVEGELVSRVGGAKRRLGEVDGGRAGYRADAAAAAAASAAFGVPPDAIATGLAGFEPARHRGDLVAAFGGVRFIDDSKATNVHAALAALAGLRDVVLIAGGRSKGVDLSPLVSAGERIRGLVAIGEAADELVALFEALAPVRRAGSIEEATRTAFVLARPGATVLLAPACASWDMFVDYAERGERFAAAARELAGEVERG